LINWLSLVLLVFAVGVITVVGIELATGEDDVEILVVAILVVGTGAFS
jgi:hypothetical protein